MNELNPYLFFNGNCLQAMKFYQSCFGGELHMMTYGDTPGHPCPQGAENRIIHSTLKNGPLLMMASDTPDNKLQPGDHVQISINCANLEEIERLFQALSQNGKVTMPLQDTFWGARFGMLVDQFGIHWMLNCEKK